MTEVLNLITDDEHPPICETQAASDIWQLIELTKQLRCIGSVVGAPGVGKTTAALTYAEYAERVRYCAMDPVHDTMTAMLTLVCQTVVPSIPPSRSVALHEVICSAVWDGHLEVLLVDEAQHLNARNLDQLRCIHDETDLPLVLLGNESLGSRYNTARAAAFAQLTSRIGPTLHLKASKAADLRAFARHEGAHEPEAIAFLEKWAVGTSGLRQVSMLLRMGRDMAGDGDIKLAHLTKAASMLGKARRATG